MHYNNTFFISLIVCCSLADLSTYEMQVMFSEGSGRSEERSVRSLEGSGMQESLDVPIKQNTPLDIGTQMNLQDITGSKNCTIVMI